MYQAPEVEHLQRAVDAVKRAIATKKPDDVEDAEDTEELGEENERSTKSIR